MGGKKSEMLEMHGYLSSQKKEWLIRELAYWMDRSRRIVEAHKVNLGLTLSQPEWSAAFLDLADAAIGKYEAEDAVDSDSCCDDYSVVFQLSDGSFYYTDGAVFSDLTFDYELDRFLKSISAKVTLMKHNEIDAMSVSKIFVFYVDTEKKSLKRPVQIIELDVYRLNSIESIDVQSVYDFTCSSYNENHVETDLKFDDFVKNYISERSVS